MARLLDVSGGVEFGYFYSREFGEITLYLDELLIRFNQSYRCTLHSSAMFVNNVGEELELHMAPLDPYVMDPEMPNLEEIFEDMYNKLNDPEKFESMEGSGWTLIPGTVTYWVNTVIYQPNNNAHDNSRNVFDPPIDDDDDDASWHSYDLSPVLKDTFLLSLAASQIKKSKHYTKILFTKMCERWLRDNKLYPEAETPKINITSLAAWHESIQDYHIRVFSAQGNVIYHKWYPTTELEPDKIINILWKNKKFKLIVNLWTLLKEKNDRIFCNVCKKFHSGEELCINSIRSANSIDVYVPEMPSYKHALVIYADFESYITNNLHKPSGYSYVAIYNGEIIKSEIMDYTMTDNVGLMFIKSIINFLSHYISTGKYDQDKNCKICGNDVTEDGLLAKNYMNGKYGLHHKSCFDDIKNTAYIFFHNFRGYDSHYCLLNAMEVSDIQTLRGKSFEKFDLISCRNGNVSYTFKDTFNFYPTSLAKLVKMVQNWKYTPESDRQSKGTFPYDWFDDPEKLNYTNLPVREFWYNKLTRSELDYDAALSLWNDKKFKVFKEYHNYYMHTDVLQLADVFEEFRTGVFNEFNTDPVYCQGAPSLTWQLCLQDYGDKIKVITDTNIYMDIQANIRGGIAQVCHKYLDTTKVGGEILYLDINSLYSCCMEMKMPTSLHSIIYELPGNWHEFAGDGEYTAILCVDLYYPEYLHDKHSDYPLAPHKFNNRLCSTFLEREKYLCHAKNLKYYIDQGLLITKFYYGYVFRQDYILKEYVSNNIAKRRIASSNDNAVLVSLYKLLNNSLYGKTCENKFKYRKYAVKNKFEGIYGKKNPFLYKSKNFLEIDGKILCEDVTKSVTLDKPIQIGFTVLEFAKLKINSFFNELIALFPEVKLLYTDTDSLMIWFPFINPQYQLIDSPLSDYFDFEKTPDWFGVVTKGTDKKTGLWSLESSKRIKKFIGLRAKTYALIYEDDTCTLKNKGIISTSIELDERRPLTFEDYEKCLFQDIDIYVEQIMIRSKLHNINTITQKKLALSAVDEKRVTLADKITTIPFGYRGERFADNSVILPSKDNL